MAANNQTGALLEVTKNDTLYITCGEGGTFKLNKSTGANRPSPSQARARAGERILYERACHNAGLCQDVMAGVLERYLVSLRGHLYSCKLLFLVDMVDVVTTITDTMVGTTETISRKAMFDIAIKMLAEMKDRKPRVQSN